MVQIFILLFEIIFFILGNEEERGNHRSVSNPVYDVYTAVIYSKGTFYIRQFSGCFKPCADSLIVVHDFSIRI